MEKLQISIRDIARYNNHAHCVSYLLQRKESLTILLRYLFDAVQSANIIRSATSFLPFPKSLACLSTDHVKENIIIYFAEDTFYHISMQATTPPKSNPS